MNAGAGRPLAVAGLCAALVWLGLALHGGSRPWPGLDPETAPAPQTAAPAEALPPAGADLRQLAGRALFGTAPAGLAEAAQRQAQQQGDLPPPAPPEPPVPLELLGALPGPISSQGYAIVGTPEGQFAYRVGEALPGGALLRAVDRQGITVARGEAEEHIPLPVPSSEPAAAPILPAMLPPAQTMGLPAPSPAANAQGRPGGGAAIARERLRKAREAQMAARRQAPAAAPRPPTPAPQPPPTTGLLQDESGEVSD